MNPIYNKKDFEDLSTNLKDLAYSYIEKYSPSKQQLKVFLMKKVLIKFKTSKSKKEISELIDQIVVTLETNTKLIKTDIIDIFTQSENELLSLEESNEAVNMFLENHPQFFSSMNGGLSRNIHKLYVMDSKYLKTINNKVFVKDEIPASDKISPIKSIFKTLKTIMPIIYI